MDNGGRYIPHEVPQGVLDLLSGEHHHVHDLLDRMNDPRNVDPAVRRALFREFEDLLLRHLHAEEETFYPFLLARLEDPEPVLQALEQHHAVRLILENLAALDVADPRWHARLLVLGELIDHHVYEEEEGAFLLAEGLLDDARSHSMAREYLTVRGPAAIP